MFQNRTMQVLNQFALLIQILTCIVWFEKFAPSQVLHFTLQIRTKQGLTIYDMSQFSNERLMNPSACLICFYTYQKDFSNATFQYFDSKGTEF